MQKTLQNMIQILNKLPSNQNKMKSYLYFRLLHRKIHNQEMNRIKSIKWNNKLKQSRIQKLILNAGNNFTINY